jgi:hypothetical protein
MKSVRRVGLLAAALALPVLALTACNPMEPGAAAVVGDTRITEQELAQQVEAILQAQGRPVDASDADLTVSTLSRMVTTELVEQAAAQAGVSITRGQIDSALGDYLAQAGSQAEVDRIFIEGGIAPSQIEAIVLLNLRAQALGQMLLPDAEPRAQGAALLRELGQFSIEQGTVVSPRYGAWNPVALQVGPQEDPLAVPPATQ